MGAVLRTLSRKSIMHQSPSARKPLGADHTGRGELVMACKSVFLVPLIFCGLLLSSCALFFYPRIKPIEFRVESNRGDMELSVLSMTRGSHQKREDGVIVVDIPSGETDITFMVRSGTQTNQFVARASPSTSPMGTIGGVATFGFRGGIWLASQYGGHFDHFEIRGVAASPAWFMVGRFVRGKEKVVPLIDKVAPQTGIQFDPQSPGVFMTGRGGASVLASGFANPRKDLQIYAPLESSVFIEQEDGNQELKVDSTLRLHVLMRPGRAKIHWFPAGSDESHVEISIDAVSDEEGYGGRLTFSSMLDKPAGQ
jgi:hypothetical protein